MTFAVLDKSSSQRRDRARAAPAAARPLLSRSPSAGASPCACGGGCPRCQAQTKARADGAVERHERQADRVAEQITSDKPGATLPAIEPAAAGMQAKSNAEPASRGGHPEQRIAQSRGGGRPLPESTRGFMEARFGADFDGVRVHEGAEAHRLNAELVARAFTFGSDIWMGANERVDDRRLMAHELTHVLQQRAGGAYIARQPKDDTKKDAGKQPAGGTTGSTGGATGGATATATTTGCDKKTTGVDNAPDILLTARAIAIGAVQQARAAFKPLKSSTITLLDRHFHCPSNTQIQEVMKTLARIEAALPTIAVTCKSAKDPDCAGSMGQGVDNQPELHACPTYFGQDVSDVFRAVTFIFAAAVSIGRLQRCRRAEACYDDYMQTAATMLENPYSYAWFAVEAAGLSPPDNGIIPCRPLEVGIYVNVPPAAKTDPTQIRRVSGFEETPPAGTRIASVWMDTSGKYFIYDDNVKGAKEYLPGEKKRYYFPEGQKP